VALAASLTGKRAAVIMKQVGLNVAADPLMSSAYTGVKGGFVVISCDDPGPHSSQTEQDTRFFAMFAKVPALDPSSPREARDMVRIAFELSEKYRTPVILRPSIRICHARQNIDFQPVSELERPAAFEKDPARWAATPRFRYDLHKELNEKLKAIEADFEQSELNVCRQGRDCRLGFIAGGASYSILLDTLREMGLEGQFPILKITTSYPLPQRRVADFIAGCERVLVLEEPDAVIEWQIWDKRKVLGRLTGTVPAAGELVPEVIYGIVAGLMRTGYESPFAHSSGSSAVYPDLWRPACAAQGRTFPSTGYRGAGPHRLWHRGFLADWLSPGSHPLFDPPLPDRHALPPVD